MVLVAQDVEERDKKTSRMDRSPALTHFEFLQGSEKKNQDAGTDRSKGGRISSNNNKGRKMGKWTSSGRSQNAEERRTD